VHNVTALCLHDLINIALILLTSIASCHFNRYVESVLFTWNSSQWFRWTNFEQRYLNNRLFKTNQIWFGLKIRTWAFIWLVSCCH